MAKAYKKHAFYSNEQVENALRLVPKGQLSERVNELILKGLSLERRQAVRDQYRQYSLEVSKQGKKKKPNPDQFMSERAFIPEDDEIEDFF